jgi:DNA-binding transcriptional LysR family regulator
VIDNLPNLVAFAQIVSTGSLSAASRELDLSLPVVSKRLAHLEKSLGVRLVQRTTRRLTLTEEGELFHGQVLRILAEIEEAESLISDRRDVVSGMLRVTAPHAFGRGRIAPIIAEFAKCHEELSVNLELNDSVVDLLETGIDLAIRFGSLSDSSMIARELAPNFRVLCASPAYVEKHGQPKDPADLFRHRCIVIGKQQRTEWRFEGVDNPVVRVKGAFVTNDGDAAHVWALEGVGIVLKSIWDVGDDIAAGRLQRILPAYSMQAAPLHAIYAHRHHLAPRVRLFVEFLQSRLQSSWRWGAA